MMGSLLGLVVFQSSLINRLKFQVPETSFQSWSEILSYPSPIKIQVYSTGRMQTELSAIMNLKHENAVGMQDTIMEVPVIVCIIHHPDYGQRLSGTQHPYRGGTKKKAG